MANHAHAATSAAGNDTRQRQAPSNFTKATCIETLTCVSPDVVARANAGERRAQMTLDRVGTHLGIGVANVICGLGVPHVVLSGDLVHGWKFIQAPAHAAIARSLCGRLSRWSFVAGETQGSELGGALEVAIEHYLLSVVESTRVAA